eukprot:152207-Pyramimonas_sp.AAC.1
MVLEIPCVDPKTSEAALADCGVLLPHERFSALFHRYETYLTTSLGWAAWASSGPTPASDFFPIS